MPLAPPAMSSLSGSCQIKGLLLLDVPQDPTLPTLIATECHDKKHPTSTTKLDTSMFQAS